MPRISDDAVREILAPFVDAGTTLTVALEGEAYRVVGTRRFQRFEFLLTEGPDGNLVVPRRRGEVPLQEHLASGAFADLDRLARSMLPFLKSRLENPDMVIEGKLRLESEVDSGAGPPINAFTGVSRALYSPAELGTSITFLHGDAGAGKSWLLMKLALRQAQEFLERRRTQFALYVDAQGVNLRSISQQIAHQLDVYNGVIRYTEVTPLVRLGALGLIIDGFDELIMPSGYNDTLRALMSYIEDFRGQGALVASARTGFLHAYASSAVRHDPIYPYEVRYLHLDPWTTEERTAYAVKHGRPELALELERLAGAAEVNRELLGRPFLVAYVFDLLSSGEDVDPQRLLATVENAFVERERTAKLLDFDTGRPLLSREQFDELLEEIAEEMWVLRQNSLDRQTARLVTALVAESYSLLRSEREMLEQKIDTHSLLEPESGGRIRFPHEIVFSRILAKRMLRWLDADVERLAGFLRVAPIKISMAEQFVSLVAPSGKQLPEVRSTLEKLINVASRSAKADREANIRLNIGSLVAYLLPFRLDTLPLEVKGLHFSGVQFKSANLANVSFVETWFQDVDARDTNWESVRFLDCFPVGRLIVSDQQRMPASLPSVTQLEVVGEYDRVEIIFGDRPTRRRLFKETESHEAPPDLTPLGRGAQEVLKGLCIKLQQGHHWIPLNPSNSDSNYRSLRRHPQWDLVIYALERHNLLYRERRSRSGPDPELAHIRKAREIVAGLSGEASSEEVRALLKDLEVLR